MVSQKYRWDFIGLSTDEKPTSATSEKVVNGSTYYCSDTSKLYVYCDGTWYERKALGGGGGGGTSDFNDLSNRPKYNGSDMTGSTNIPEVKTYTAGSNVAISDQNVISATDTTYSNFVGTDGTAAGTAGLVPAPATTDAGKFLGASGLWETIQGGGGVKELTSADYNYPAANPNGVAMWLLDAGVYVVAKGVQIYIGASYSNNYVSWAVVSNKTYDTIAAKSITVFFDSPYHSNTNPKCWGIVVNTSANGSNTGTSYYIDKFPITNLTSTSNQDYLSAYQGKVLKDFIGDLTNLTTTDKTNLVAAINEAATKGYVDPTTDSSAPTTATVGRLGQIQIDTTTATAYMCVAVDTVAPAYTWKQITG